MSQLSVSFGKTVKDNKPTPISLSVALERIKNGDSKDHVLKIRKLHARLPDTEEEKAEAKRQSDYVIFQGTFSKRAKAGILQHSGLAILDLDHLNGNPPEKQRQDLFNLFSFIHAAWVSPSGDGVKAIARIPIVQSDAEYKQYYNSLLLELEKFTPNGDKSNKDISRICFESYDPEILIRPWHETTIFNKKTENVPELQPVNNTPPTPQAEIIDEPTNTIPIPDEKRRVFESLRKGIITRGNQYTQNNRHNFLYMLIKDCIKFGIPEKISFALIVEVYTGHKGDLSINEINEWGVRTWKDNYSDDIFNSKKLEYSVAIKDNVTNDVRPNKPQNQNAVQKAVKYLDYILKESDVLFNTLNHDLIIRDGERLETLYVEMKQQGMNINKNDLFDLLREKYAIEFDPVSQYFVNLLNKYTYKQVQGSINHLCTYVEACGIDKTDKERMQKLFNSMLKKHMIRAVGQGRKQYINRFVFVLQQKRQNTGKSTFIKFLNPWGDKELYSESLSDKDPIITLSQAFMINLEELEAFTKKDVSHIKALISKGSDQVRKYYSQIMVTLYRIGSFWASTNKTEFLDDGENTRWINIPISRINFNYNNTETGHSEVNIHKCWAEAAWCWKNREPHNPTPHEWTVLASINKDFAYLNDHDHWVQQYIVRADEAKKYLSTSTEIANYLRTKGAIASPQKTGQALQKAGYDKVQKRIDKKSIKGYYVMTTKEMSLSEELNILAENEARNNYRH